MSTGEFVWATQLSLGTELTPRSMAAALVRSELYLFPEVVDVLPTDRADAVVVVHDGPARPPPGGRSWKRPGSSRRAAGAGRPRSWVEAVGVGRDPLVPDERPPVLVTELADPGRSLMPVLGQIAGFCAPSRTGTSTTGAPPTRSSVRASRAS